MYEINKDGVIRSCPKFKGRSRTQFVEPVIKQASKNSTGYLRITVCKDGVKKRLKIHQCIAKTFIPNPKNLPQVNHKDGNKLNNAIENLEWCTGFYNMQHAHRSGLVRYVRGKDRKSSKPIIQFDLNGNELKRWESISQAARFYNYSKGNIINCCRGRAKQMYGYVWKYIV